MINASKAIEDQLYAHLCQFRALPILFVGSGLSRRYLGAPAWAGLLDHFAKSTGRQLAYYAGRTDEGLPGVATEIGRDFYETWWSDARYEGSRLRFGTLVQQNSDPLKIEISAYISAFKTITDPDIEKELLELRSSNVHAIVTTNWDQLLEECFPEFEAFVGQEKVLFSEAQGVGEIYKIHGSIEDPTGLVLTASDYRTFQERNPYLVAKLLTFFVEHPVIFIGYSLTDPHIQQLLTSLLDCLTSDNVKKLNDRLIFVRRVEADAFEGVRTAPMVLNGRTLNVIEVVTDDFGDAYRAMGRIPRRFPVRLLRQLKKSYTNWPIATLTREALLLLM